MTLHMQTIVQNIPDHLVGGRQRVFWHIFQALAAEDSQNVPALEQLYADLPEGLDSWAIRLIQLPDGDFICTHHGSEISAAMGYSKLGRRTSHAHDQVSRFLFAACEQVAHTKSPLLTICNDASSTQVASWQTLIVPAIDDGQFLNIIAIFRPIERQGALTRGLLDIVPDPILVLEMIRDADQQVIDARVLDLNTPALEWLDVSSTRHLHISDCAPELLQDPLQTLLHVAYAQASRGSFLKPFILAGRDFSAATAVPNGDGAIVMLKEATETD